MQMASMSLALPVVMGIAVTPAAIDDSLSRPADNANNSR
jgi:hypothetical protein